MARMTAKRVDGGRARRGSVLRALQRSEDFVACVHKTWKTLINKRY
jgi:hypothetical protein